MWKCECGDVEMCRCGDVLMWRCRDLELKTRQSYAFG